MGVTAGDLSDAFLLGVAGAMAVVAVSAFVGGIRWLFTLDRKMSALDVKIAEGFIDAARQRGALQGELRAIGRRVETVEREFLPNDGTTALDAIYRIDRRSRKVAESVGAVDYDDEDEGSDEVTGHGRGMIGPPAPR